MNNQIQNQAIHQRKYKISILFLLLVLLMFAFLFSVYNTINSKRRIPSPHYTIADRAFRGAVISADKYTLSNSQKTYQAVIRGASIDPQKRTLFIRLFSIYSSIDQAKIEKKFKNAQGQYYQGNIILSDSITARFAMQLKTLAYKLRKLKVFRPIKTRGGVERVYGLDIVANGEKRRFPLGDVLSPVLGYVGKNLEGKYIYPSGKKGIERAYDKYLKHKEHGYFRGKRDVLGAIVHDNNTQIKKRVDGYNVHLNIPLALQRRIELISDKMSKHIDADEIMIGIMESKTGKVLALASSQRYDPAHIKTQDRYKLNPKFSEYPYEAGSVMKPLTLAIALDHNVVTPYTWFDTDYARFHISKRRTISDDDRFKSLTATGIIIHSSNIGASKISWRVSGEEFREGLLKFGVAKRSGIDLSRDLPGSLKPLRLLNNKMHRANTSYGYGMMITFAQLIKAYSAFNNDGLAMTPRIVSYLQDSQGKQFTTKPKVADSQAISKKTANQIKTILKKVVQEGTGKEAQYEGLEIGGKTGTAHIAKHGRYVKEYHSSFYGFANDDKGNKYTIGVLVIRAKAKYKYFASQSAVPSFRKAVEALVELDYLKPILSEKTKQKNSKSVNPNNTKECDSTIKRRRKKAQAKHKITPAKRQRQKVKQRYTKTKSNKSKSVHELFHIKPKRTQSKATQSVHDLF